MTRLIFIALLALAAGTVKPLAIAQTPPANDRFSVEVRGQGPDVILIPGLASSRDVWKDTAARLATHHRVHVVQIAGFAGEEPRANANGAVVAPVVDEMARYIVQAKLQAPAVVGHSMGGEIALALAVRHPQAVGRVMVVDALPFFSLLFGPTVTAEQVRPRADAIRDAALAMSAEQFRTAQERTMVMLVKSEAHRPAVLAWSLTSDRGTVARAMHELMTTDLRPELPNLKAPVTVLYAWDASAPWSAAQVDALYASAYKALPSPRLVRIDGSSHFMMWDQPERFAAEVEAFVAAR